MKPLVAVISLTFAALLAGAPSALAGSKYQTTLVPTTMASQPGFSASGSSIQINGKRALKGKIKKVVDGTGTLVTTDPTNPADNYTVEVDLAVPATASSGTVTVSFDVKNGNGTFSADLTSDPVFTGAMLGDGVSVLGVRVKDSTATVIGTGGVAIE